MRVDDEGDATSLTRALADEGPTPDAVTPSRWEDLARESVAALRASVPVDRRVASAFDAMLSARYGSTDGDGDAGAVVDAVAMLDRARADLFRVLRAWMGEGVLHGVAPLLEVRPVDESVLGGELSVVVRDDEFRMTVPRFVADDPVTLMAVFADEKRRVGLSTGGDFGPDAADPDHYRDCVARSSGDREDCTCLSGSGEGRPKRMAVAADGTRFVIVDSDNLVPESDPARGGLEPDFWRRHHGELRELFMPGSAEPWSRTDRVWVAAEVRRGPDDAFPFVRELGEGGVVWSRDGASYPWPVLNRVPLVSGVVGPTS